MKILFDTNVVVDLLLDRRPFSMAAGKLFSRVESEQVSGYLCATTVTTLHYLASKVIGNNKAHNEIKKLLTLFSIAAVNQAVLQAALTSKFNDYEDAVLHESALVVKAQGIVSRNTKDFKHAKIPVYLPDELLEILNTGQQTES